MNACSVGKVPRALISNMNIAEQQVNFLIKASAALSHIQNDETRQLLRSHYLLKCSQLTGGVRLPLKHFSHETRCSHCLLEWTKGTERRVRAIKLSKSQRHRIRSKAKHKKSVNKEYLLHSNSLETVCSFCKHTTKTPILKPSKNHNKIVEEKTCVETPKIPKKPNIKTEKIQKNNKFQSSVYYDSKEAFSLTKQNTLPSLIKDSPKIIKNNKRKKDKFAGLCQAAVIASAKLKEEKEKQSTNNEQQKPNKLSLFLKPSS